MNRLSGKAARPAAAAIALALAAALSALVCSCAPEDSVARPQPALGESYAAAREAVCEIRDDALLVGITMEYAASDVPETWCYVFGSEEAGCFYAVTPGDNGASVVPSLESHWRPEIWQRVAEATPGIDADEAYKRVCDEYFGSRSDLSYRMSYFAYAPADGDTAERSNEWIVSVFDQKEDGADAGGREGDEEEAPPSSRSFSVDATTGAVSPLQ